jgi:hypothetical protein
MDAEVVIGFNDQDNVQTVLTVLQHFISFDETTPKDDVLYFVYGRIASVDSDFVVGKGFSVDDYDFLIDADIVSTIHIIFPAYR